MDRKKIINRLDYRTETGYYNEFGNFIIHSFEDHPARIYHNTGDEVWIKDGLCHRDNNLPAIICKDGTKFWYENDNRYWLIDNQKYFDINEVYERYKDKIINVEDNISQHLIDANIDFMYIEWNRYLILDDSDRNEIILRYSY